MQELASINVENNEDNRRRYRELIVTAPNLSDFISGAIYLKKHSIKKWITVLYSEIT